MAITSAHLHILLEGINYFIWLCQQRREETVGEQVVKKGGSKVVPSDKTAHEGSKQFNGDLFKIMKT